MRYASDKRARIVYIARRSTQEAAMPRYDQDASFWADEQAPEGISTARPASNAARRSSTARRNWSKSSGARTSAPAALVSGSRRAVSKAAAFVDRAYFFRD